MPIKGNQFKTNTIKEPLNKASEPYKKSVDQEKGKESNFNFKINFRNQILKVAVNHNETTFTVDGDQDLTIIVNGKPEIASKFVQIN